MKEASCRETSPCLLEKPPDGAAASSGYGVVQDKSLWWRRSLPVVGDIRLNPVVYLLSLSVIVTFVTVSMMHPTEAKKEFGTWKVTRADSLASNMKQYMATTDIETDLGHYFVDILTSIVH